MRYRWPENTLFTQVVLSVEQEVCSLCQRHLHVCDHRFHPILSLQGPLQLVCKLAHCPDPGCPAHCHTLSPHGNRTSNRWKTKELREVLNVPSGSLAFDFERSFAGISPQHR